MAKNIQVKIKVLAHAVGLDLPKYATAQSAGADLVSAVDGDLVLKPGERKLVPTGLILALPEYYEAQIRPRSGLALKNGVTVLNSPGTIDADYRGEVKVLLANLGVEDFVVKRGDRIAQMIIAPVVQGAWEMVADLDATERGTGGFGSTGVNAA